jgi:hypothetical protein
VGLQQPPEIWPGVPQENQREKNAKQTPGKGKERFCIYMFYIYNYNIAAVHCKNPENKSKKSTKKMRKQGEHFGTWSKYSKIIVKKSRINVIIVRLD